MNIKNMLGALTAKREHVELKGFKFYARPMSVLEYGMYFASNEKESDKDDQMILRCIENESGEPVFTDIKQVQSLYTNVRFALTALISKVSFTQLTAEETEKK
ncbi:phage tail assembly chaperone family protein, TAC [Enterobacter hormaechei]|uniref:phage tail assembly chaperone family protein, TAC n=1 Tax=Enterobacter hormaechei TaxID=158836 RepID=UPI0022B2E992|nr:phage tail assembly chaperone family protein, TAC [Enterobacter hormaechei]WAZ64354.1 phage tail assembly chaperone family protein, TAC [Enterobacter hormaechei]